MTAPTDPRTDALSAQLDEIAESLFGELCVGDGEHSEALDRALILKRLRQAIDLAGSVESECAECVAKQYRIDALQQSIDGCAKRVAELYGRLNLPKPGALSALIAQWRKNADLLAEGTKGESGDPAVGMQLACASELEAILAALSSSPVEPAPAGPETPEAVIAEINKVQTLLVYDAHFNRADRQYEYKPESIQVARESLAKVIAALTTGSPPREPKSPSATSLR